MHTMLRLVWDTQLRWLLDSSRLDDLHRAAAIAMAFPTLLTREERDVLARRGQRITRATLDLVNALERFSPEMCSSALVRGADLQATHLNGGVPFLCTLALHTTRGSIRTDAWFDDKKVHVARHMMALGARVSDTDPHTGRTPLHNAASWGATDLMTFFVRHGANPSARDRQGRTPSSLMRRARVHSRYRM